MVEKSSLTTLERTALTQFLNLSDGHTRPDVASDVEDQLVDSYRKSSTMRQGKLEADFLKTFFSVSRQKRCLLKNVHLTYSASSAIQAVASYCVQENKSVALIEPVFDNIPRTLKLFGVKPRAIPENRIRGFLNGEDTIAEDVFWLVLPNNPTGFELDSVEFEKLVDKSASCGKILVIDFCFRQYSSSMLEFDQYRILDNHLCQYVGIEDTGKTWASQELKLGMLRLSGDATDIHSFMAEYHDNLLLRVSPFVLHLLTTIIENGEGLETSKRKIRENSSTIKEALSKDLFAMVSDEFENWPLPMEWIRLRRPQFPLGATDFTSVLQRESKVLVLPGSPFFWQNPNKGEDYIRVSLARNDELFSHAVDVINNTVKKIVGT